MNKLDKDYQALLQNILDKGRKKMDRTGTGTLSVFGREIRHDMSEGFPLLTTKKMYWKGILVELLWFLRGDTNIKFLVDNDCHIWDGDAYKNYLKVHDPLNGTATMEEFIELIKQNEKPIYHELGELGPVYGKQWRMWGGIKQVPSGWHHGAITDHRNIYKGDQIKELIDKLNNDPDSRRLMVNSWNVGEIDEMTLPPCHYSFECNTEELTLDERINLWLSIFVKKDRSYADDADHEFLDKRGVPKRRLNLKWTQRSCDLFLGFPFNIASYGLLLTLLCESTNMVPGELIGSLGDTHLYLNHLDQAKEQISREPMELPELNINTEFWNPKDLLDLLERETFVKCLIEEDIQIYNYKSHPAIKAPLSN
jgi:thymidylate synthase